jgi:hypothetical protein
MASLDIALQHIPDSKPPTVEDGIRDGFEDNQATQSDDGPIHEFSLPRADGGKQAWLFLAGCFFIEALVWGELFSLAKSIAVHLACPWPPEHLTICVTEELLALSIVLLQTLLAAEV